MVRYCWHGQMSSGLILRGQISPWHMASVKDGSRNLPLKFGQNWLSNSWNIADMDKCHQVKCYLGKSHRDSWHLLKMVLKSRLWSLLKIGSVTAEILLIRTNVARPNVAWTTVHLRIVLDGQDRMGNICLRWSQKSGFEVWSKSGQ